MRCAVCGSEAVISVSEGGVETALCGACCRVSVGGVRVGSYATAMIRPPKPAGTCPHCGTTAEDVEMRGLAGCPLCYEALPAKSWDRFLNKK